jgi:hypothetical protein
MLGIAYTFRWYALFPGAIMVLIVLLRSRSGSIPLRVARAGGYLIALPLALYIATFIPWIARGYSFPEWVTMQLEAYRIQGAAFAQSMSGLDQIAGANRWLVGWIGAWVPMTDGGGFKSFAAMVNDPIIWVLFMPSVLYLGWLGFRERQAEWVLIASSFLVLYGFFLTANRPIYLYSALSIVQFGVLAVSFAVGRLLRKRPQVAWTLLGLATLWCIYLLPLATALPVPGWAYDWLVNLL